MKFAFADLELDPATFELRRAGTPVPVPRLAFNLLLFLIRNRERPVTKAELFEQVWEGRAVTDASLSQAITAARRAIGDSPITQAMLRTVHGRGYWWVAPTEVLNGDGGTNRIHESPLIGRDSELQALTALWEKADSGRGALVLVAGEAGIGKTRLIECFAQNVRSAGAPVVWAFAQESRPTAPLSMWQQVVAALARANLLRGAHAHELRALVSRDLPPAAGGEASRAADGSTFGGLRARTVDALSQAFQQHRSGLLVILEDLHRADAASLQVLDSVASRVANSGVLLVGTTRPIVFSADDAVRRSISSISARSHVALLPLQPLTRVQVELLLQLCEAEHAAVELIWERSGGNPFFVCLLMRLSQTGSLQLVSRGDMPNVLARAVAARCEELPPAALRALRMASAIGKDFDAPMLRSLLGGQDDGTGDLLDCAEQAGLIEAVDRSVYRFRHAIVRDALYEDLGSEVRAELHHDIAKILEVRIGAPSLDGLSELAHHLSEGAAVGAADRAVSCLVRCGETALSGDAPEEATRFFSRALALSGRYRVLDDREETQLMAKLGESLIAAGRRNEGREMVLAAARRGRLNDDHIGVARCALALAPGLLSIETGQLDPILVALLEDALAGLQPSSPLHTELQGRLALALYWAGEDKRRRALVTELAQRATRLPGANSARAHLYWVAASWAPGLHVERRERLDFVASERRGVPRTLASVLRVFSITSHLEVGEWASAKQEMWLLEKEVQATRDPLAAWYPPMYRAMVALAEGRLTAVDGLINSYASLAESSGDKNVEHCVAAQLGEASWLRGQTELAIGGAEALVDRFPGMPEWRCVLAYFLALEGRTHEASARISEVELGDENSLHENMNTVLATCALADAAVRAGLRTEAEKVLPMLRRYRNTHALAGFGVVSWGSVERFVGRIESLLGDWTRAEESLREALSRDAASGAATLIARSELALAEMLVCRGAPGARKEAMRLVDGALRRIEGRALTQLERDASRVGSAWSN